MLTTNISIFKSFLVMHMCIKHNAQIFLILETERFREKSRAKAYPDNPFSERNIFEMFASFVQFIHSSIYEKFNTFSQL